MQKCLLPYSNYKLCNLVFILCIVGHISNVFTIASDILVYSYK